MGTCKYCHQWHCDCDERWLNEIMAGREECEVLIQQHRALAARHDPDFQRFMAKTLHRY